MSMEEKAQAGIKSLPGNLQEAVMEMQKSEFVREILGDHIYYKYIEAKTEEFDDYRTKISQWELENYLTKY
jgi:glutamine synthetase